MNQKFQDLIKEAKWDGWDIVIEPVQDGLGNYNVVRKEHSDDILQFVLKKNKVLTNRDTIDICNSVYDHGDDLLHYCSTYNSLLVLFQSYQHSETDHIFYVVRHDVSLQKTLGFYAFYITDNVVWPIGKRKFVHDIDTLKAASSEVDHTALITWIQSMKDITVQNDQVISIIKGLSKAAGNKIICQQHESRVSYIMSDIGDEPTVYDIFHRFVKYGQWEVSLRPKRNTVSAAHLCHILFFAGHGYAKTCLQAFDGGWLQDILGESRPS